MSLLPKVVLGTLPFGGVVSAEDADHLIERALAGGIRAFDVSHLYGAGNALGVLSKALAGVEHAQVWCSIGLEQRPDANGVFAVGITPLTSDAINRRTTTALEALDRDQLSVLNIHAFDESTPLEITLGALRQLKDSGIVDRVSYSNISSEQAKQIVAADSERVVDVVQVHGSVLERRLINTTGRVFQRDGRALACFRPLARGLLTREYSPENPRPSGSRSTRGWRLDGYLTDEYLDGLARLREGLVRASIQPLDFALSWLVDSGPADTAIVGVRDTDQLDGLLSWLNGEHDLASQRDLDSLIPTELSSAIVELPLDHFER